MKKILDIIATIWMLIIVLCILATFALLVYQHPVRGGLVIAAIIGGVLTLLSIMQLSPLDD